MLRVRVRVSVRVRVRVRVRFRVCLYQGNHTRSSSFIYMTHVDALLQLKG